LFVNYFEFFDVFIRELFSNNLTFFSFDLF